MTAYLEQAGLTPYLEQLRFHTVAYGCTTCIGNSGPLSAPVAQAIEDAGPGGRLGAVGQPELRGPGPPRGAGQLPDVAAPGGGLRHRRPGGHRPADRAARHRPGRQAGLPARHLADHPGGRAPRWPSRSSPRCSATSTPGCSRAIGSGRAWPSPPAPPTPGIRPRPTSSTRPTSRAWPASPRPVERHPGGPGARPAGRQHHDRPHLAGRLDQEGQPRRQVPRQPGHRCPRTSTPTAPAGATTRSWCAGTFANTRLRNLLAPGTEGGVTRHLPDGQVMSIYDAAIEIRAGAGAAAGAGRQGVRQRLVAGLGGQGDPPAGGAGGDRRELTSASTART